MSVKKPQSVAPRQALASSRAESWESWASLMARVQGGDREAYRRLLDEVGPLLYAYVRRRVFDPDLVPDVYQDLMLRFHRVYPTYEPSRPFGPWLFVVARHSIWDSLAKIRRVRQREIPMEQLPEPEADLPDDGLGDVLSGALGKLPAQNREAIELLKLKGLSLAQAAGRLGISIPALKARAHKAYLLLRQELSKGMPS